MSILNCECQSPCKHGYGVCCICFVFFFLDFDSKHIAQCVCVCVWANVNMNELVWPSCLCRKSQFYCVICHWILDSFNLIIFCIARNIVKHICRCAIKYICQFSFMCIVHPLNHPRECFNNHRFANDSGFLLWFSSSRYYYIEFAVGITKMLFTIERVASILPEWKTTTSSHYNWANTHITAQHVNTRTLARTIWRSKLNVHTSHFSCSFSTLNW